MASTLQQNLLFVMKNILLPGGIGYIGSHVMLELLLHTPHNLIVIDNYYNSSFQTLQRVFTSLKHDLSQPAAIQNYRKRVEFREGNILDLGFLEEIFRHCEEQGRPITSVIHFAAKKSAPQSVLIPLEYYENNFVGTMNLLKMMERFPTCREFIFSSTAAVYGEQDNCTEEFKCLPISPYGESKLCVDMMLRSVARTHPEWKVISLRYFNPAGNHHAGILGDSPIGNTPANLFSIIQETIIGIRTQVVVFGNDYHTTDGTGVRDFVHVVDLAKGHLQALEYMSRMEGSYDLFNFGSRSGFSVLEVLQQFSRQLEKPVTYVLGPRREGDLERLVTASMKAEQVLGWKAQKTLKEMCESCIKFTTTLRDLHRKKAH